MTELIIIGNGFDLAHGMKTAYSDYIRAMLLDALIPPKDDLENKPTYGKDSPFYLGSNIASYLDDNYRNKISNKGLVILYRDIAKKQQHTLSHLIESLLKDIETKGWADLEQSYFDVLCILYKQKEEIKQPNDAIKQLNEDMRLLEKSLHSYLKGIKPTHKSLSISKHIIDIRYTELQRLMALLDDNEKKGTELYYKLKKMTTQGVEQIDKEDSIRVELHHLDKKIKSIKREIEDFPSKKFVALNFNYTDTIGLYFKENEYIHIPIHNTLADDEIILGYGDETCEMYKTLENTNDNELLKYFKSFYYMKTSHYRDLERIVSSGKFRIHLMGHSCGLSDRVLLSSLFNHENLDTIRVYYYEPREDNNDHFDKCLNISRHFLDKHQMRCKILPLKGPEDTLEYASLTKEKRDLLGLTKSVALIPHSEQDIKNSDRWEALHEDSDE